MSLVPLVNASLVGFMLVSTFFWKLSPLLVFFLLIFTVTFGAGAYVCSNNMFYMGAFWLFIASEVCVFGTLFVLIMSHEAEYPTDSLSDLFEIPFIGCFILLGSSVTATMFHHCCGLKGSRVWLCSTVVLGLAFVFLQMFEFSDSYNCWSDSFYHSCCFSIVGLHFSHVVLGLVVIIYFLIVGGSLFGYFQYHYSNLVVWYWHFVDYIWLFVYFIVYVL